MVEVSGRGPQLGRILDTNRAPDTFFGPESQIWSGSEILDPKMLKIFENHEK